MQQRHRRQLRNLLLDSSFQLRSTLIFVVVCLVLTSLFGGMFYHQLREASRVQSTGDPALDAALEERFEQDDRGVLLQLIGGVLLLTVALTAASILRTHRIVGPLHVLQLGLEALSKGQWPRTRELRTGDEFRSLIDDFHTTVARMRRRHEGLAERLEGLADAAPEDMAAPLRDIAEKLRGTEQA